MKNLKSLLSVFIVISIVACSSTDDADPEATAPDTKETTESKKEDSDSTSDQNEKPATVEPTKPTETPKEEPKEEPKKDEVDPEVTVVNGIKYGANYIIFEPQITDSDLGKWVYRKKGDPEYFDNVTIAPVNDDYLEFEGNSTASGKPNSPIEITFTCPKTAKYNLMGRLLQNFPLGEKFHDDHSNDVWVQLAGDFSSATSFSTEELKKPLKFFGRGKNFTLPRSLGTMGSLEGNHKQAVASYNLKKDEVYTITISGRSKNACIDYFMFYDVALNLKPALKYKTDPAEVIDKKYQPALISN